MLNRHVVQDTLLLRETHETPWHTYARLLTTNAVKILRNLKNAGRLKLLATAIIKVIWSTSESNEYRQSGRRSRWRCSDTESCGGRRDQCELCIRSLYAILNLDILRTADWRISDWSGQPTSANHPIFHTHGPPGRPHTRICTVHKVDVALQKSRCLCRTRRPCRWGRG